MGLRLVRCFGEAVPVGAPSRAHRRFGVPVGGPFDAISAWAGRISVGEAFLEQWEVYGTAEFEVESAGRLVRSGAQQSIQVDGRRELASAFRVQIGQRVEVIATRRDSARLYLTFAEATAAAPTVFVPTPIATSVRYVPGPDDVPFSNQGWRVTPASNRIGIRLAGPAESHSIELSSRPTTFGSIQVPPGGQPIVLGPDGPTIGGYPQAGVVISVDLAVLAHWLPGMEVSFTPVTLEEARSLARAARAAHERLIAGLDVTRSLR